MFCLTGCGLTDKVVEYNNYTKEKYEKQAEENAIAYLQEKYPNETFEVVGVLVRKAGHNGFFEKVFPAGYSEIACVKVCDKFGSWHTVTTNADTKGQSGKLSCTDDVQKDEVITAIQNELQYLTGLSDENILDCRISFSDFSFNTKYEGDIPSFLSEIREENSDIRIYGGFVYDGNILDFSSFGDEDKYFLYFIDRVLFVAMMEDSTFPININANIRFDSSLAFLYPYARNILDVHEYNCGISTVYKNYTSTSDEIIYSVPFEYYDTINFYTEEITDISQWNMAIKSNSGYEWVKYNEVDIITPKYLARNGYVYFLSCESLGINTSNNLYSYFLLTKSGTNRRAFLVKNVNYGKTMFIDGYLYVGDMEENDEWCIIRVKNREK